VSRSLSRLQALLLGAVVLLGAGLAVTGLFAVGSRGWFGKDALHVRVGFPEIRGVEVGTRVRIQGIDAGEVESIAPPAADDPDGLVLLRLRLKGEYRHLVRADSSVKIVSEGMLGGKVLEIRHGRPQPGGPTAPGPALEGSLLASEPSADLADILGEVGHTLKGIQGGEGTLGKLARDQQAYDSLVGLLRQGTATMQSIQQDAEALKRLPVVGGYVEDPVALLVRPGSERNRQWFAEDDLFEPGRAVLTARGRQRLDELAPWLEGLKHKGSDVVVVSYADPAKADRKTARAVTLQQSEAVCAYLKQHHAIQKMGWFTSRKVTALGQGVQPPPAPERDSLPPARVEVLVFVPQG
jgi:phospholipid/cholesterol/gamma-HCH transport system substrate-binding protein